MVRGDQHIRATPCKSQARSEPSVMRRRVEQAWRLRWGALLACASARAFAASLLDLRPCGADGAIPHAHEVVHDFGYSGFSGLSVLVVRLTDSSSFHFSKNERPYAQCRAVCSMQGRVLNAGPHAGPHAQCWAVCLMQDRMLRNLCRPVY